MERFGIGISKFYKVSFEQFKKDFTEKFYTPVKLSDEEIREIWDDIKLPKRATTGSAGYDFFMPAKCIIAKGESVVIPTGIRCCMDNGWVLKEYPRSGHGFKTGIHLANTVGIIDSDYFYADNEGHIMIKLVNDSSLANLIKLEKGSAFCQGIFIPFGITIDDDTTDKRHGGFGSTSK